MTTEDGLKSGSSTGAAETPAAAAESNRLRAVLELWRRTGKRSEIPVTGGSMFPVLRPGWLLVLDHAEARHPFGSVIVFRQGRLLVAHRVVGRRTGDYRTKGDALLHFDRRPVRPDQVLGRVVAVRVNGREISLIGRLRHAAATGLAVYSCLVGEVNRMTRPLARLTSPAGRFLGSLPGPTRILGGVNRVAMRLAARCFAGRQWPPRGGASTPREPRSGGS
jgi:hypothetical protein